MHTNLVFARLDWAIDLESSDDPVEPGEDEVPGERTVPDSIPDLRVTTVYEAPRIDPKVRDTVITSTCGHNRGGRCVVNAHMTDGRITRISTDMRRWNPEHPPLPACARGVGQMERTYHPDRLRCPMRRTGPRGSGQFERITWDEALDADRLARGKAGGYPADLKLIYSAGGGLFNQAPNAGKIAASLEGVEFIVGQDHFLTPTVGMADIVLPATTFWERNDVHVPWSGAVAFAAQIRDPEHHRFNTRSGKIEVYSTTLAAKPDLYGLGAMPPIPTWIAPPGPNVAFPLMLCSPKSRARTHSTHGNQPGLARVDPDDVWLNIGDAAARGIANGQLVRIFNNQGATVLPAVVTDRIAPGVVSIKEGAWFAPDETGTDTNGCANALAMDRSAPCGATTYNTNYVQVSLDDREANHAGS